MKLRIILSSVLLLLMVAGASVPAKADRWGHHGWRHAWRYYKKYGDYDVYYGRVSENYNPEKYYRYWDDRYARRSARRYYRDRYYYRDDYYRNRRDWDYYYSHDSPRRYYQYTRWSEDDGKYYYRGGGY